MGAANGRITGIDDAAFPRLRVHDTQEPDIRKLFLAWIVQADGHQVVLEAEAAGDGPETRVGLEVHQEVADENTVARRLSTFARNSRPGESLVRRPVGSNESSSKTSRRACRRPVSGE